ncbi:pyridoxal phosphate-dependent aminotransferase [Cellulomonas endophytica]|uniref:pyridoxal phosphate-dependent aminotransferase n=1 Tax=Cellulomonas endophytica TaxID=2494735 RepID=UPI00101143B4|nr:aminotransferase class I/II-fold pyridoxal phosphate-dependent enzyme [Cellulomonas endophytica]
MSAPGREGLDAPAAPRRPPGVARRAQVPPFAVMEIVAAANARRAAGEDVLSLCVGEPAGGAPAVVRRRAAELVATADLGYTEAAGVPALRRAIAGHYARTYGLDLDPRRVVVTTGSSGGFVLAVLAAFDAGDRVALARPGYPAYANILTALGCDLRDVPCGPADRYQPTPERLDAVLGPQGAAGLVVASPSNPTGTMLDAAALDALVAWGADRGTRLVVDEIYHGLTYAGAPPTTTAARSDEAVVVSSFSKLWGMTGWRLGWLVLPEALVGAVDALAGSVALSPPALPQHAALAAFSDEAYAAAAEAVERYARSRAVLLERLPALGWSHVAPADGAFYLWADVSASGLDSVTWCARLLDEAGVALTPGTDFDPVDGHRFVRLSFAVAPATLAAALDRVEAWQAGLHR